MSERKIAVVTEDGERVSNHFGMAPAYRVFSIVDSQILTEEERLKPHHAQHPRHEDHPSEQAGEHGHSHADMFAPIADCQVLLCGGMGQPAYQKAVSTGLEVVLVSGNIRENVQAYLDGRVISDHRRIHQH